MIVCLCERVSDRDIRAAVQRGCQTVGDVARVTGAARQCGACACDLKRAVRDAQRAVESLEALPLAAK